MIRRAVQRKIQRDLHAARPYLPHEPFEILHGPEGRLDASMTPFVRSNGPRGTYIAQNRGERVVLTLSVCYTDGMNRRKIDDIEAHGLRVIEARQTIAEPAVFVCAAFGSAREELIPR